MDGLPEAQNSVRLAIGCKPRLFNADFVSTDSKLLYPKEALSISAYTARLIRQRVYRDFRFGKDRAGGPAPRQSAVVFCA